MHNDPATLDYLRPQMERSKGDPATLDYMRHLKVADIVEDAIEALVKEKPADARAWLAAYLASFAYPPIGLSAGVQKLPEWIQAGCGDKPYNCAEKNATFGVDGTAPAAMPDLSKHSTLMAQTLVKDPSLYGKLKDKRTPSGVTFAECIKTGVDNLGHPMIKLAGITAGDEESYETFKDLFDPVIDALHGGYGSDAKQPTNLNLDQLSTADTDPYNKYVRTSWVRARRSIRGFKLPPVISFDERRELEALAAKALLRMEGDLKGDYFPLHGSRSYAPKPTGMPESKEEELREEWKKKWDSPGLPRVSEEIVFHVPDSTLLLASGMGRHWPDGRGIFRNEQSNLFVWLNEEDHLSIMSVQGNPEKSTPEGKNIKEVTARLIRACDEVQKVLKAEGKDFMHNDHLGWVVTSPRNLGTGLRAGCQLDLQKLTKDVDRFRQLMKAMRLRMRPIGYHDSLGGVDEYRAVGWQISNADRIGRGEVDLVNTFSEGIALLTKWEEMLAEGKDAEVDAEIKAKIG